MTTQKRQIVAENYGVIADIGKKVKSTSPYSFRSGDIAEIIGWGLNQNNLPLYFIRFENGECDSILGGNKFNESGYMFIE